ncbi:hypothetical protein JI739_09055 [Ramlibacter sp. AW1]|uniref:PilY1 beta-propeller domain-containing protein n=1 Tax=Ramlibacter aurantiacus TaxID=2801330 RepID=A0A937D615_9BURK|nr:PilC/PilY family type IV pilus protein [Ramlibacter aurantiacus]MBL0420488.1 hypothetical protein [Ramlibacter aurantiacus]
MITLDDSGSMRNTYMPDRRKTHKVGRFEVIMPLGGKLHPKDNGRQSENEVWVVAGVTGSSVWQQPFLRSADTNTIYYDPRVRYLPWRQADGSRLRDINWSAVPLDPSAAGVTRLDFSAQLNSYEAVWCYTERDPNSCGKSSQSFNPGLYYVLQRDGAGNYRDPYKKDSYREFDLNSEAATSFTRYPGRTDCAGSSCSQAEERRNFANWYAYYRSRMLLAKAAMAETLYGLQDSIRLGYGRLSKAEIVESGVRDYTPKRKSQAFSWLESVVPESGTPLREAVRAVGTYYQTSAAGGPWTDKPGDTSSTETKSCRRAYHLLVTDGYWSVEDRFVGIGNIDGGTGPLVQRSGGESFQYRPHAPYSDTQSDTLADFAMHYWREDLQPAIPNEVPPTPDDPSFWQGMSNLMIGLGVTGTLDPATDLPALASRQKSWTSDKIDDLWHAALNSRGRYFSATNATELSDAIREALNLVVQRELLETGVAASSGELADGTRKYRASYRTGIWIGDVEAFELDADGQVKGLAWSAKKGLPTADARQIVTWDAGTEPPKAVPFKWSALSAQTRSRIGTENQLNYVRGDRSNEGAEGFRRRQHPLGDFINSPPLVAGERVAVEYGGLAIGGAAWTDYRALKSQRARTVYIGGNAGMLHGFRDSMTGDPAKDGVEVFAYVPGSAHAHLKSLVSEGYGLADEHRYFVDGVLREADVYLKDGAGGAGGAWRNLLLGSTGAGPRAVFAIDITDPESANPDKVRWEISDPSIGHLFFPIEVGVLPNGEWKAIFGNGYGTSSTALLVVDIATGRFEKIDIDLKEGGLGGVSAVRDAAGQITALYAGDLKGRMWKFEYDASAVARFRIAGGGKALFEGDNSQPILQPPLVLDHPAGGKLLVFGTGRLITAADAGSTDVQAIYAVRDQSGNKPFVAIRPPMLQGRKLSRHMGGSAGQGTPPQGATPFFSISGDPVDWKAQHGWMIPLDLPDYAGLRALQPTLRVGTAGVLLGLVTPGEPVPCRGSTARGINLVVPPFSGAAFSSPLIDVNGDGTIDASDAGAVVGWGTSSDGVDAVLIGASANGKQTASIQSTGGSRKIQFTTATRQVQDRVWRRLVNDLPFK